VNKKWTYLKFWLLETVHSSDVNSSLSKIEWNIVLTKFESFALNTTIDTSNDRSFTVNGSNSGMIGLTQSWSKLKLLPHCTSASSDFIALYKWLYFLLTTQIKLFLLIVNLEFYDQLDKSTWQRTAKISAMHINSTNWSSPIVNNSHLEDIGYMKLSFLKCNSC